MVVLNDYVRQLPMLKDSPKAVPKTKKGNIPFGEADLAAIVLASVLMDVVAEPVQPQLLNSSRVNSYIVTGP
jgi:hypothetical protein